MSTADLVRLNTGTDVTSGGVQSRRGLRRPFVAENFEGMVFKTGPSVLPHDLHIELGRCLIMPPHINFISDILDQGAIFLSGDHLSRDFGLI
jgi:hypothetical protein